MLAREDIRDLYRRRAGCYDISANAYDAAETFTQVSNVKGTQSGVGPENIESVGTYEVNEDCRAFVTLRFVIVDDGDELLYSAQTYYREEVLMKCARRLAIVLTALA